MGERGGRFNGGCIGGCMALTLEDNGAAKRILTPSLGQRSLQDIGQYETPRVRRVGFLILVLCCQALARPAGFEDRSEHSSGQQLRKLSAEVRRVHGSSAQQPLFSFRPPRVDSRVCSVLTTVARRLSCSLCPHTHTDLKHRSAQPLAPAHGEGCIE